ncbi:methyltransferase [Streptomyces venezuelae]|uniref:Methyltransferase n=1 Tax=Streptomyces venezuelae TaxID=54571 RepID=A0A5P2D179_STRVZ|nr:methyltransferase domain-containing protein [Streptomyces venezuelae]QES48320.1 methyltransferase [Streptomyces venezuelae]
MSQATVASDATALAHAYPTHEVRDYQRSLARSVESRTRADRPSQFELRGRTWDLLDEVFAPVYSPSTSIALDFLGWTDTVETPRSGSMLEIGCGTGVISVMGALAGCRRVVAADINPHAVDNARLNAHRHGVTARVQAVHSDLFSGLDRQERFDLIFFSSNYVLAPAGHRYASEHDKAYVDPGYSVHRRYLAEVCEWLTPNGSALLHFSSRGDMELLRQLAAETGRKLLTLVTRQVRENDLPVDHILMAIVPAR